MSFNKCMRMVPLVRAVPARTFFSPAPWPRPIGSLIRDMDRQMERLEREVLRGLPSLLPAARRALPIDHTVEAGEAGDQYRVSVDLAGYRPEEVSLSLDETGRRLTVSARCERRHGDGTRLAQEMTRTITLPESIDADRLTSLLHHDGVLAIEAPFKEQRQRPQAEPYSIPVTRAAPAASPAASPAPTTPELEHKEADKAEAPSSST